MSEICLWALFQLLWRKINWIKASDLEFEMNEERTLTVNFFSHVHLYCTKCVLQKKIRKKERDQSRSDAYWFIVGIRGRSWRCEILRLLQPKSRTYTSCLLRTMAMKLGSRPMMLTSLKFKRNNIFTIFSRIIEELHVMLTRVFTTGQHILIHCGLMPQLLQSQLILSLPFGSEMCMFIFNKINF